MGLLNKKDTDFLESNRELFEHSTDIVQKFRTPTEMNISVLNDIDNPTADAKYWQLQREVNAHYNEIKQAEFEMRRKLLKLERLTMEQSQLNTTDEKISYQGKSFIYDSITFEDKQVDIDETKWSIENLKKVTAARVEELRNWKAIQEDLKPQLEFSDTNPDEHQLISYTRKFIMSAMALQQSKASASEAKNILAHLYTSIRYAKKHGLLNKIVEPFKRNPNILKLVSDICNGDNRNNKLRVISKKE